MTHVFVSGGSRGIGRAVVEAYLRKGFNVSFIYHFNNCISKDYKQHKKSKIINKTNRGCGCTPDNFFFDYF